MLYIHVGNKVVTYSSGVDKVITLLIYDKKDFHIKIKCKSTH